MLFERSLMRRLLWAKPGLERSNGAHSKEEDYRFFFAEEERAWLKLLSVCAGLNSEEMEMFRVRSSEIAERLQLPRPTNAENSEYRCQCAWALGDWSKFELPKGCFSFLPVAPKRRAAFASM